METTFIWILGIILFLAFIFVVIKRIGVGIETDYNKDYDQLVMYVRDSLITLSYYNFIRQKFTDIKRYKCRDKESLSMLEEEFKERFKKYIELRDEHDPANLD
jgi:hypothetical protein